MTESLIRRTYVVAEQDDTYLESKAAETDTSKSAILRRIIREWAAAQAEPARVLVDTRESYNAKAH